jgi:hypothetical protein
MDHAGGSSSCEDAIATQCDSEVLSRAHALDTHGGSYVAFSPCEGPGTRQRDAVALSDECMSPSCAATPSCRDASTGAEWRASEPVSSARLNDQAPKYSKSLPAQHVVLAACNLRPSDGMPRAQEHVFQTHHAAARARCTSAYPESKEDASREPYSAASECASRQSFATTESSEETYTTALCKDVCGLPQAAALDDNMATAMPAFGFQHVRGFGARSLERSAEWGAGFGLVM